MSFPRPSHSWLCIGLASLVLLLMVLHLLVGSVRIAPTQLVALLMSSLPEGTTTAIAPETASLPFPLLRAIVVEHRLPIAVTAALSGAALSGSGLFTQTLFRNPLADPSLLGIHAGAALGAALAMLVLGRPLGVLSLSLGSFGLVVSCAFWGAMLVLALLLSCARRVQSTTSLLIVGLMISFGVSSLLAIFTHRASAEGLRNYQMWLLGDCGSVGLSQLPPYVLSLGTLLLLSTRQVRSLDAWLLGETYAQSMGVDVVRKRLVLLLLVGALSAIVTALCGPIAFVGLAAPHLARLLSPQGSHHRLWPLTLLLGSALLLLCQLLARLPMWGDALLPLNAITPLVGAPLVVYVLLRARSAL